jgi:hypothetical protein
MAASSWRRLRSWGAVGNMNIGITMEKTTIRKRNKIRDIR